MNMVAARSVLREKWGVEVVEHLERWMREIVRSEGVSRDEYREILSQLDTLEQGQEGLKEEVVHLREELNGFRSEVSERFDRMNDSMNERFDRMNDSMNERFDRMNSSIDERFDRMNSSIDERFGRMNEQFNQRLDALNARMLSMIKWTVGTIALFGTIISVLMAVFKFVR